MRPNPKARPVHWTDRTLSVLRAGRLEACEKELEGLGGPGLFDAETTDADAERLFSQSYLAEEDRSVRLHSIEEMRVQVLSQFPAEMGLLNQEEFTLLLKLALFGGELPIYDWNDLLPARSLVYRMWCRMRPERGHWICMPRQICVSALMMLASEELKTVRDTALDVIDTVDNTLYLAGMMPAETIVRDLGFRLQGSLAAGKRDLFLRLIRSSFDTLLNREGQLVVYHPGLADPRGLLREQGGMHTGLDQGSMEELYGSLTEVEDPLYEELLDRIRDLCRPEANPEDTVEDLILLAKQGAPTEEMREVLGSKLICLPTEEMTQTLEAMHQRIPRWMTLNMERMQ